MIYFKNDLFAINTRNTTMILRTDESSHFVMDYYGKLIKEDNNYQAMIEKWSAPYGSMVISDKSFNKKTSLDSISLEYSSVGKGDFNEPSIILRNSEGYCFDFTYDKYTYKKGVINLKGLPAPHGECEELVIFLSDKDENIALELHYFVFEDSDIILRNSVIKNRSDDEVTISKLMSMQMELRNDNFKMLNLYGGWCFEGNKSIKNIEDGIYINDSKTGNSSNRRNPFFMIFNSHADLNHGDVYAYNFIYSGNYYEMVEKTAFNKVRVQIGINPYCFSKKLTKNKSFITPLAVMTYSSLGWNGASQNMHDFINNNIVRKVGKDKPIAINNWEVTGMQFKEEDLLKIARSAKKLGVELFVLDDGWFTNRNNDTNGLGDWDVDKKKLPHGIEGVCKKINKIGLKFGLWFEPEMINQGTEIYKKHPEWAITCSNRNPSFGRNQLVLDLSNVDVRRYLVEKIDKVLSSCNIEYVKWDMNRNISDFQAKGFDDGEFFHRYILGLYEILDELTNRHQNILFEGCASGGNRFDLGILCYMQQNWTSDDTDAYQRIFIQSGMALGYPLSCLSNHVNSAVSQQLLRRISLNTRFNVAAFGVLGFECNVKHFTPLEKKLIVEKINFYKEHKELFQYGNFYQLSLLEENGYAIWEVISKDKSEGVIGYFNSLQKINNGTFALGGIGFDEDAHYEMSVVNQENDIRMFGALINVISPVKLKEDGFIVSEIAKRKGLPCEKENYIVSGSMINNKAIVLNQEWSATGYDEKERILGDFGSRLYYFKKIEKKDENL